MDKDGDGIVHFGESLRRVDVEADSDSGSQIQLTKDVRDGDFVFHGRLPKVDDLDVGE